MNFPLDSGIWEIFPFVNPGHWALESRTDSVLWIRNPTNDWNTETKTTYDKGSGIHSEEFRIQDCLRLPYIITYQPKRSWTCMKMNYCAFHEHANSKVQKPPSQSRFSLPSIIITITSNEPWNTETHWRIEIHQSQIANLDLLNPLE